MYDDILIRSKNIYPGEKNSIMAALMCLVFIPCWPQTGR